MKDEIVAIVILCVLVGVFIFNSHMVETKTEKLLSALGEIEDDVKGGKYSKKDVATFEKLWNREKKELLYFYPHGNIRQIDECVRFMRDYAGTEKPDRVMYYLRKARHHIHDIAEREKIRLDNIF